MHWFWTCHAAWSFGWQWGAWHLGPQHSTYMPNFSFVISGSSLDWFRSLLNGRTTMVAIGFDHSVWNSISIWYPTGFSTSLYTLHSWYYQAHHCCLSMVSPECWWCLVLFNLPSDTNAWSIGSIGLGWTKQKHSKYGRAHVRHDLRSMIKHYKNSSFMTWQCYWTMNY